MNESPDEARETRAEYAHFLAIPTRWMDNDAYGHVNNVVYYSFFDTVVNAYLVDNAGLDIATSDVIGVVAETMCRFRESASFPDIVHAGLRVTRIGKSSVRYEIGIFRGDDDAAAAAGYFVHVYVDRATRRPVPVPARVRAALELLVVTV
jgi:acyl-CoA thioester hydrolase